MVVAALERRDGRIKQLPDCREDEDSTDTYRKGGGDAVRVSVLNKPRSPGFICVPTSCLHRDVLHHVDQHQLLVITSFSTFYLPLS